MFGFVIGVLMGVTFAVLGAGGGTIAVPVLRLLFSLPLREATGAGLGIVFAAALTSAIGHARQAGRLGNAGRAGAHQHGGRGAGHEVEPAAPRARARGALLDGAPGSDGGALQGRARGHGRGEAVGAARRWRRLPARARAGGPGEAATPPRGGNLVSADRAEYPRGGATALLSSIVAIGMAAKALAP